MLIPSDQPGPPGPDPGFEDFTDLHDLIMAPAGIIPVSRCPFRQDPRHNLTDRGIATAIHKLESSGIVLSDRLHVLNHWR